MPKQALLVIDIQEDYTGTTAKDPFPYKDSNELITTVNKIIEKASEKNLSIVYIRQEYDGLWGEIFSNVFSGGTAIKGNPGTKIDQRISIKSTNVFPKPKGDAFSNPLFDKFLIDQKVDEIYLVGLDAEFCVYATATGGLNRGYNVNIITDAIALKAKDKWNEIITKYTRDGINLLTTNEF